MHSLLTESLNESISIEEAHQEIDEAIEKFQGTILALKSRRNRYAPISRLPPEILSRIFFFAKIQPDYSGRIYPLRWIKLTHVTRHWRNIAVNSPSLWVDLPFRNLPLLEEMLRRSKDASLVIDCDLGSSHSMSPGLELALQHSARAKHLSLRQVTSNMWTELRKLFPESAARLEYFTLSGYPSYIDYSGTQPASISITGRILCETRRLRHLELTSCNVNWTSHSHLLSSLSHLKLHNMAPTSRPNGKQFVDILKGMPDLEFLDLQDVLPVQTGDRVPWTSDSMHFASLQTLIIRSTSNELESFFSCVTFPPTATVNIVCSATDAAMAVSSGFILNIGRSYSNCSSARIFESVILRKFEPGPGLQLKLYTNALTNDQFLYSSSVPSFQLAIYWKTGFPANQALKNFLFDIFSGTIPLQYVQRIYLVESVYGLDAETIANTFGMLPDVRHVFAASDASRPFIDSLKLYSHDDSTEPTTAEPTSTLCFPRLSSICIRETDFDDPYGLTVEGLQDCFIHRYESGVEIEKLTLNDCLRLGGWDVDLLAEIVVEVDWDGQEVFTEDEEEEDDDEDRYFGFDHNHYDEYDAEDFDESFYGDDPLDFW